MLLDKKSIECLAPSIPVPVFAQVAAGVVGGLPCLHDALPIKSKWCEISRLRALLDTPFPGTVSHLIGSWNIASLEKVAPRGFQRYTAVA